MSTSWAGRRIYATASLKMRPYDLDGPLQPDMSYAPLSHDACSERGSYLMRMEPGAATIPHVHACREEFLILERIPNHGFLLIACLVKTPGSVKLVFRLQFSELPIHFRCKPVFAH